VLIAGVLGLYAAGPVSAAQMEGMEPAVEVEDGNLCLQEPKTDKVPKAELGFPEDRETVTDTDTDTDTVNADPELERPAGDELSVEMTTDSGLPSVEPAAGVTGEMMEQDLHPACQGTAAESASDDTETEDPEQPMPGEDLPAAGPEENKMEGQPFPEKSADAESEAVSESELDGVSEIGDETKDGLSSSAEEQSADVQTDEGTVSTASAGGAIIETDIEIETIAPAYPSKPSGTADQNTGSSRTSRDLNGYEANSGSVLDRNGQNGTTVSPSRSDGNPGTGSPDAGSRTSQNGPDRLPKTGRPLGKTDLLYVSVLLITAGISMNWLSRRKQPEQ